MGDWEGLCFGRAWEKPDVGGIMRKKPIQICEHCNKDISIRNPSGFCDHLYYPENCLICEDLVRNEKGI